MKKNIWKSVAVVAVLLACGAGAGVWFWQKEKRAGDQYRLAEVKRGNLQVTIGATGTIEPDEVVDIGAQVAGQILGFGTDKAGKEIDYGSAVEEGMLLARIDETVYAADVAVAEAQLQQSSAAVTRAQADLTQMQAKLFQAQRDWERAQKLGPSEALAESSFDAYRSAFDVARANVTVSEAAIIQARASVAQSQAARDRARRNLGYCTIKSPVRGVIIDRRVNIGQTVVSSLNAPSLFLIAKDLRRMQLWVAVNEADIGSIRPGQKVRFAVDAYPGEQFYGTVDKVRLNATMSQNVVTYTVEVNTDNSNGRLLPYLTANVWFELDKRENVLLVPNAALRWQPQLAQVVPECRDQVKWLAGGGRERGEGGLTGLSSAAPAAEGKKKASAGKNQRMVWVPDEDFVRPVKVTIGLTDGVSTEVQGEGLSEGLQVVVGEQKPTAASAGGTTNPFVPQLPRPPGGGGGGGMGRFR